MTDGFYTEVEVPVRRVDLVGRRDGLLRYTDALSDRLPHLGVAGPF